jgi:hypothetical protein
MAPATVNLGKIIAPNVPAVYELPTDGITSIAGARKQSRYAKFFTSAVIAAATDGGEHPFIL